MSEIKPINQCDGCIRGLPIVHGIHRAKTWWGSFYCTADRYRLPWPSATPSSSKGQL